MQKSHQILVHVWGHFYDKPGKMRFFFAKMLAADQSNATNISGGGDKPSQYSYLVVILSNWVPDNWVYRLPTKSSAASRGAPHGVATLKVRKGAFDALNKGSGALGKLK